MKAITRALGWLLNRLWPAGVVHAGYLDENIGVGIVDDDIATWPAAAAPANGVSMPAALKWINDALQGAAGVVTFPASAAPANAVSLAEVIRAVFDYGFPKTIVGETDIDDSAQTETTPWAILTITPASGAPLSDVEVIIDLAKATTGYAAVESTATIQLAIARKVDGTNWRREAYNEAALSGTLAAGRSQRLNVGSVGVDEEVAIYAVMSADATDDMELPYIINYKGMTAPTVTEVAAA
jgi:hypothetical protein